MLDSVLDKRPQHCRFSSHQGVSIVSKQPLTTHCFHSPLGAVMSFSLHNTDELTAKKGCEKWTSLNTSKLCSYKMPSCFWKSLHRVTHFPYKMFLLFFKSKIWTRLCSYKRSVRFQWVLLKLTLSSYKMPLRFLWRLYLFSIISLYNRIHKHKLQNEGPGFYVTG